MSDVIAQESNDARLQCGMVHADMVLEALKSRRSFKPAMLRPDAVDAGTLGKIMEAACWAPSHGQTEPWRFSVFTGESRRGLGEAFASAYRAINEPAGKFQQPAFDSQRDRVWTAPVWISLGMQPGLRPDGSRAMPEEEEVMAVACAVQNLHVMTCSLGLGGQWTSNPIAVSKEMAAFVGLVPPGRLLGFFFLGWPVDGAAWPPGKRRPMAERVTWAE